MAQSRQLAAIMFTDIVGYTALMDENEKNAIDLLRKNRQMQQQLVKEYNGIWIKELGNGILTSFQSVTNAVYCATSIQQASLPTPDLKIRIGIHLGEVVFEKDDVYGDGVNIASRIQALTPVGSIWVSEAVYKNVANKKEFKTKFIREETLKNVKEPITVYEVELNNTVTEAANVPVAQNGHPKKRSQKSIAVLPFVNMSTDPEQEYFSDGMSEEIINSLVHLQDLKVAGRMSSFQFKGVKTNLQEIGEKLGVSNVLEGSVRKQGNRLRVTVQLINMEDGFHLWSEKYDR
ncbi:MAG TPA: FlgO family outer membrane protein, partial [Chitinophagaceae bacterium]|nr:FlgO family outer membrane protein [Chitinophagaceae bacterium]